jgi:Family of unknown function (DUF6069)
MTQTIGNSSVRPNLRPVLWLAPLAGILSSLVNGLIWLMLRGAFDTIRVGPPGEEVPFWSGAIPLFSLVGAIGAGIVYTLIARFSRRPNRVFLWVASALLVLSFVMPLSLKSPPVSVFIGLELMHVIVFVFVLWLVPRRSDSQLASPD